MRLVVDEYGTISGLTAQEEADRQKLQRLVNARDLVGLRRAATRDSCDLPDFLGLTALMGVAQLNAEDRMKLVEMDAYDRRGYIAMNEAWRSDEALWKQLVELGDPTCANTAADSCLHHAVKDGNSAAASALLAAGASANARNQCEYTPLIQAVTCWAPQHVSQVLLDSGADWSLKNNKYRTALALATQKRNWRLAELLRGLDGDFYPVTDPQGYCLIINISRYESGSDITFSITERKGSDHDVEQAKRVFERLRFIVKIKKDLTTEQLDDFLSEIKKSRDLAKHGSFVCFLMAHGSHDCIYGRDGCPYEIRKVIERFQTSVCRSLEGKPKVFFIQAGRGSRQDRTFASYSREETRYNLTVCTPESDFLVCYANSPGSVAFRSINTGSLYVQTVCDFIEKNFRELDLSTIMT
uniref:ANK_REP_REGION domain-containing protein n=1 Tax=Macrostomum lignano TaxID=282301 RepID=A0A1I8JID0_9PLAT